MIRIALAKLGENGSVQIETLDCDLNEIVEIKCLRNIYFKNG